MKQLWLVLAVFFASAELCIASDAKTGIAELPAMAALQDQTSISGLSSGGFMAAQYHVAYSKHLVGVGIVAGGPWNCAGSDENSLLPPVSTAVSTCMTPCKDSWFGCRDTMYPNSEYLALLAKREADRGGIDDVGHLRDDKVYIFSGTKDPTVATKVVDSVQRFYRLLGVNESSIKYDNEIEAGHGFITAEKTDLPCASSQSPYINNCGFQQARSILEHIYGGLQLAEPEMTGQLLRFNQREFTSGALDSMDEEAYVYLPRSCYQQACRIHVAFHGCRQGASVVGRRYVEGTGYNRVADNNNIIVLYPQVKKSNLLPMNPRGCWDFWGYSSNNLPPYNYYKKSAPQMEAVQRMIARLAAPRR